MSKTFTIETEVSYQELWDAIWGSDGSGMTYWCSHIRKADGGDIDLWGAEPVDFKVYDTEEEKWHTCTLEQLAEGYRKAVATKQSHCGHYSVADLEESDACTGDLIVQLAIFGEIVYG